jgi:hypothetical protein
MRTDLASGAWIEYRPIDGLKRKHKTTLAKMTSAKLTQGVPAEQIAAMIDGDSTDTRALVASMAGSMDFAKFSEGQQEAIWAMVITGWSYGLPVPEIVVNEDGTPTVANIASFDELPLDDSDEIEKLLAPYQAKLTRRPDPKGTTTSSSNGSSRGSAAPASPAA